VVRVAEAHPPEVATRPDLAVAQLACEQNGVVSVRQLNECGLNSGAITVRVRRAQLHRIHRGVYAVGTEALTLRGTFTAAVLACGADAVLSHRAAAAWHAMLRWHGGLPDVIVPRGGGRAMQAIRSHRSNSLDPFDVWRRDGILVTSPARTVLDLAADMSAKALRRMVRQAFADRILSVRQLHDVLARSPRHPGAARLRALLADGYVPTRSELEDRALDLLAAAGIERPEVNPQLVLGERAIEPDLLWRKRRLVVELDGATWHDDRFAREDDAERQALLEAHGYRVLRISWRQLVDHPRQTIARLRAALALEP
jgi:very-short-patch-repair endonuclease